jgi:hypothetical protein
MQFVLNHVEIENEKITRDVENDENDDNELKKNDLSDFFFAIQNFDV